MAASPRITIITPSLNQGRYLERTVLSVLHQGYPDLEYIVVDGGSTDESVSILERYDDRIAYWVSEADNGQAHAINKGLARATGDIVAYVNSDDYYLPGALHEAARRFADPEVRWVAGACRYEYPDGSLETLFTPAQPAGSRRSWIREIWYVPQTSSFWRREVFDEHGGVREDLSYVFDTEFGLRLALAGVVPHLIDKTLAVRYVHDEAKSADKSQFDREWERVAPELERRLNGRDAVADVFFRAKRKARLALRR
jgi:glycosyltransferase involved in cell wall biosynthesis